VPPLFHLVSPADLDRYTRDDLYAPPSLAAEGFVHLSHLHQVAATRERFFAGIEPLCLLEISPRGLPVREDPTPDGSFPHLLGPLPRHAIVRVHDLPRRGLPEELALAERLVRQHAWYDHPEGPKFVETHRDSRRTCGHWLFLTGATSAFHQVLDSDELWLLHHGRLLVHVIDPEGGLSTHHLGLGEGESAVIEVPAGHWQAAELPPGQSVAFGSNVCAPPFEFAHSFKLAERAALLAAFPMHAALVSRLTRDPGERLAEPPPDWRVRDRDGEGS
jgi:predicted cupin superfamily sugar epimerase/uncharacterized protein (DUF952 family)